MTRNFDIGKELNGVNLKRKSGGADKRDLIDLFNGFVNTEGTVQNRPGLSDPYNAAGSARAALTFPSNTVGVFGFEGKYHTFHASSSSNGGDSRIVVHVLRHPTGGGAQLSKIWACFVFLGKIYVVAEFTDAVVRHYWLNDPVAWTVSTVKQFGDRVQPTTPNGYYYRAATASTIIAWQPQTEKGVGDQVQPTTANGFAYGAATLYGPGPHFTSNTEPNWSLVDGASTFERHYETEDAVTPPPAGVPDPNTGTGGTGVNSGYYPLPPRERLPPTQED